VKRLLLLTIALIVYGSLYPWQFDWWRSSENPVDVLLRSWPGHIDRWLLRDVAINVLLYVPLGLSAFLVVARCHSRGLAVFVALLLGVGLSTCIELAQVYVPGRVSSLLDITTNSIGTAVGVLVALMFRPQIEALTGRRQHKLVTAAALLLACWGTCQLFPFFPALSRTRLRNALAALASGPPLSGAEVWANAAEWFAAGLALQAVLGRVRWWWLAGALALVGMRPLIATRTVTLDEVAGLAFALLLWISIPGRWKLRVGVWSMAAALVLRELAPFHFSEAARPFSWIPFQPTLDSERQTAVVILARKAFDYGVIVWLLRKCGVRYLRAGLAVAAALFGFEWAQVYLPGRTAEITDSVLAILMAAALWVADVKEG
jgi:VanZ family protein